MFSAAQQLVLLRSGFHGACILLRYHYYIEYFQWLISLAQCCCSAAMCCNIDKMWFGRILIKYHSITSWKDSSSTLAWRGRYSRFPKRCHILTGNTDNFPLYLILFKKQSRQQCSCIWFLYPVVSSLKRGSFKEKTLHGFWSLCNRVQLCSQCFFQMFPFAFNTESWLRSII